MVYLLAHRIRKAEYTATVADPLDPARNPLEARMVEVRPTYRVLSRMPQGTRNKLRERFEALWIKLVELNRGEGKLRFSMGIVKGQVVGESRRWVYWGPDRQGKTVERKKWAG
jgi:hypothetical protein